jgi:succinate dehydrogenase / fumarate reductase flavoprotein subunit
VGEIARIIESDVLVIGGAGAAVMSAVHASRAGVSVAVASKGKAGKSGNTVMIGGGFGIDGEGAREVMGLDDANPDYTRRRAFEKLVYSGFFLGDQRLQKIFVDLGPKAVEECLAWAKEAGQFFRYNARSVSWRTSGAAFGKTVAQGLKNEASIAVYEDIFIAELLKNGGRAAGALGIDVYSGELVQFNAKAIIVATGGFQPFSLKNSNTDMTGDGIALGLRAGARVVDMEFLLFIGTILEPVYARGSILPFLLTFAPVFQKTRKTDLDGRELVFPPDAKYQVGPYTGKVNKLLMAEFYGRGIYEKFDTHGNAFYYDYSAYTDDELRAGFQTFADTYKDFQREGYYNGIDLRRLAEDIIANKKRLKVAFGNEYSMGGLVVDPDFSVPGVPGLFAAGEVSGGTFGAFRSGDGLTEMLVHGYVAGESAAAYAKKTGRIVPEDSEQKAAVLLAPFTRTGGLSPIEARTALEAICDAGFDFFRDGTRLARAYDEIVKLHRSLKGLFIPVQDRRYNLEWLNSVIVRNLALVAEIGIYGALNRRESRGTHLRADFPAVNNREYLFNFVASLSGDPVEGIPGPGGIVYEKRRPEAYHVPLAAGNFPSAADFLAEKVLQGERRA